MRARATAANLQKNHACPHILQASWREKTRETKPDLIHMIEPKTEECPKTIEFSASKCKDDNQKDQWDFLL